MSTVRKFTLRFGVGGESYGTTSVEDILCRDISYRHIVYVMRYVSERLFVLE
jgi:hypothetical protein